MARGYPDFYGQRIFPRYGTPTTDVAVMLNCPNLFTTGVFAIVGSGRTYDGGLHFWSTNDSPGFVQLTLDIDGVIYNTYSLADLLERNMVDHSNYFVSLTEYRLADDEYHVVFWPDFTFHTSIEISVINNSGGAFNVTGALLVSLIL